MVLPIVATGVGVLFGGHVRGRWTLHHGAEQTDRLWKFICMLTCLALRPKEPYGLGPVAHHALKAVYSRPSDPSYLPLIVLGHHT